MQRLRQDLALGLRRLRHRPGFALAALLTLAVGLGANVAVFSLVEAVLLTPPPYPDPDRLVVLFEEDQRQGSTRVPAAATSWRTWRDAEDLFSDVAAYSTEDVVRIGVDGESERLRGARVSAGLFALLGVAPERGRGFEAAEDRLGGPRSVVVSHALWQRHLGGVADVVGSRLELEDGPVTVVGVMPAGFAFPAAVDVWAPIGPEIEERQWMRGLRWLRVVARLADGVAPESFDERLAALDRRLVELHPDVSTGYRTRLLTLAEERTGDLRSTLWLLQAAVLLVLGVAVANLGNLLLTQAVERRRELALRSALGARRGQLFAQLTTESALLVGLGGALGLLLALALVRIFSRLGGQRLPPGAELGIDPLTMLAALGLMVPVALLLAAGSTLYASRTDLAQTLRGSGSGTAAGGGGGRVRSALVALEVAAALILSIGAGSTIQGYARLSQVDPGFETADTAVVGLSLSQTRYPQRSQRAELAERLVDRLAGQAHGGRLALASQVPLVGAIPEFEVRAADSAGEVEDIVFASYQAVDPGYFETLGIPRRRGRGFDSRDHGDSPDVAILGESLAARLFGDADPVGRQIVLDLGQASELEVVGVVADVRQVDLGSAPQPALFVPLAQNPSRNLALVMRTPAGAAEGRLGALVETLEQEIGGRPVVLATTLENVLAGHLSRVRLGSLPLLAFGGVALFLALVGVHGVVGFTVVQRRKEIALRRALGAEAREVLLRVLVSALRPVAVGVLIGVLGAWGLHGLLERWLMGTGGGIDPRFVAAMAVVLAVAALIAALVPARRALRLEPMQVLREDG